MSGNLLICHTWRVRYYRQESIAHEITVIAPNKMFARWAARDAIGWSAWFQATRVTVSLVRKPNMCR